MAASSYNRVLFSSGVPTVMRKQPSQSSTLLLSLTTMPCVNNFLLVKVNDAIAIYKKLLTQGIVVRDRSRVELCEGCLRITVGTPEENRTLLYELAASV